MVYLLTNIKHSLISGYLRVCSLGSLLRLLVWWRLQRLSTSLTTGLSDYKSLFLRISAEAVGVVEAVEAVHLSGYRTI